MEEDPVDVLTCVAWRPCLSAGCYAEYVVAEEGWLAKVPDNLPLDEAAGVPLVALTAWQVRL